MSSRLLSRIDRYIAGLFWSYFFGGLLVFVTLFVAIDAMGSLVSNPAASPGAFIQYYLYSLPEVIHRMLPVSSLLATLFALSTLNKNNELVALFGVGMSLYRIAAPIFISVFVVYGVGFYLSDQVIPKANQKKNFVYYHDIKMKPSLYSVIKNERIWYRSKDTIFNIKTLNEQTNSAQGLTLYYFDEAWNLLQMMTADRVHMQGSSWVLKEGSVTLFAPESSFPLTAPFKEKTIVMGEDAEALSSTAHTSDILSLKELKSFIRKNKDAGLDTLRYEVDYYSKYGFAFTALVMAFLGIPFGVARTRSGSTMVNVGICLGLVFVFWAFYSSSLTLGNYGYIPPVVAAWLPNIIMLSLGLFLTAKPRT